MFERLHRPLRGDVEEAPMNTNDREVMRASAVDALVADAGCPNERAASLVAAIEEVAVAEALGVASGTGDVGGSPLDARVNRLRHLVEVLPANESFPNQYELSAMYRITAPQARSIIRTYQARYSSEYRSRMDGLLLRGAKATPVVKSDQKVWKIEFDDPSVLSYAVDKLERNGLAKNLERDNTALTLVARRDRKTVSGKTALDILGIRES